MEAMGHSGYAKAGSDIVCAGISALVQALAVGIKEVACVEKASFLVDEENATIKIWWPKTEKKEIQVLAETIVLSLKTISESYAGYVKFMEVRK